MAYESAFEAPFRIVENRNKRSEKSPTHSVVFNFTREEAVKAANWFMAMAERVDTDGTTCSLWDREKKEAYDVPGFAVFASCWERAGRLAPPAVTSVTDGSAPARDLPF
jgi:N6-adenosine-specific RNA methylase IME4